MSRRFPSWLLAKPWMVPVPPAYQPTYSQRPQVNWRPTLRVRPEPVERAAAPTNVRH